jgi:N-acyl-D-amino-acid deacylase
VTRTCRRRVCPLPSGVAGFLLALRPAAALLALGLLAPAGLAQPYDLLVRGGRVVDGTGNPARVADVAVTNGRIAAVGRLTGGAKRVVDAAGLIVAPGFIDLHTHADEIAEQPKAENFVRMGVTTVVAGNCGSSTLDVAGVLRGVEDAGAAVNFATLVGHNMVRERAMGGSFDRPPTAAELARMQELVARAMREGAVGLSTGLIYLPGTFADTAEIIALARVAGTNGGLYATHMRNESTRIFEALDEATQVSREGGLPLHVSHLKLGGESAWGQASNVLAYLDRARATGLEVSWDQYAYTASSTGLRQLIPDSASDGGREKFLARLDDPAAKAEIVAEMKRRLGQRGREDYGYAMIASYRRNPALDGLSVVQAAERLHGTNTLDAQIETILEIQRHGGASAVFHGMNEDDLQTFLRHPFTAVACDSGLREFGVGVPHPRGYGNNARILARYVRELGVLRLEDAIRRMTSLPAADFGFTDRGQIRPGAWADLAVFDPAKVQDHATYKDPHHYATGFAWVFVNGVAVVEQDRHTGARPGQPLRGPGARRSW